MFVGKSMLRQKPFIPQTLTIMEVLGSKYYMGRLI
jgi:hypothetical protein